MVRCLLARPGQDPAQHTPCQLHASLCPPPGRSRSPEAITPIASAGQCQWINSHVFSQLCPEPGAEVTSYLRQRSLRSSDFYQYLCFQLHEECNHTSGDTCHVLPLCPGSGGWEAPSLLVWRFPSSGPGPLAARASVGKGGESPLRPWTLAAPCKPHRSPAQ